MTHTPDRFDQTGTMDTTETGGPLNSVAPVFVEAQRNAEAQPQHRDPLPAPAVTPQAPVQATRYDTGGPAADQPEQPVSVDYDTHHRPTE